MRAAIIHSQSTQEYWFEEGCHIQEIGNRSDDPQVSVARARVPPGRRTRWHCLEATVERYLVTAGQGVVEVGDLPPSRVVAGDLVVIPSGVRQRIHNDGERDLVFYAICSPRFDKRNYRPLDPED